MKRTLLFLFLALTTLFASAQEEVRLRVTYSSTFVFHKRAKPLPSDTLIQDEKILEIGKEKAVFYSRKFAEYEKGVEDAVGRKGDVSEDIPLDIDKAIE